MLNLSHILTHLPYLAEVARTSSFTEAAQAMNLTQAAVSYQIKQLEEKTGSQLVVRKSGSQLKLTSAGKNLTREYNYCAKRLTLALDQLDHTDNQGELRITSPVDFGSILMPKIMAQLKLVAPKLIVDLHTSDELMDLTTSKWDMSIRVNSGTNVINPNPLYTASMCLVANASYLHNNGIPKKLKDLVRHTILLREKSKHRNWNRLLDSSALQFNQLQKRIVLGNSFAMKEAAKEGLGMAILPEFIVRQEIKESKLVPLLKLDTITLQTDFFLARIDAPQLESYEQLLREVMPKVALHNE